MPADYKKYPIFVYNEPATYEDFSGGVNTDPSNENLTPNQLINCVNMHYSSGSLIKRRGAKLLSNLSSSEDLFNIQGVFIFTYRITYIIVAADGKLYKGFYNENGPIVLERLPIAIPSYDRLLSINPADVTYGLPEQYTEVSNINHDGFILAYTYVIKNGVKEKITYNYLGDYFNLTEQPVYASRNDVISQGGDKFLAIKDTYVSFIKPNSNDTYTTDQSTLANIWSIDITGEHEDANEWDQNRTGYEKDEYVSYLNLIYKCNYSHTIRKLNLSDTSSFIKVEDTKELIFQNSKKIEAATYKNKLYIATGTRFIVAEIVDNQLVASPVVPYLVKPGEDIAIGLNNLSAFPETARVSSYNQIITSLNGVSVRPTIYGTYMLEPFMTYAVGDSADNYYWKWEKYINNEWLTIISFKDNIINGVKTDKSILTVPDATNSLYRVTFGKGFKTQTNMETLETSYELEDIFTYNITTGEKLVRQDYIIDGAEGEYFGSAQSQLFNTNITVSDTFNIIQSCTKIHSDSNKFILYGDKYNSGQWFKTVIDNPGYITDRGSLSFKTTKNEAIIKVIAFGGDIIIFANSDNVGGSIHIVTGAGDDYEDQYYSPYRRRTLNSSISCDNPDTVQILENYLAFKYFNTVYLMRASDLSKETINLYSVNDLIKAQSKEVQIPWDDNTCISELTEDYYALLWKEQYIFEDGELILKHSGLRIKMYYKLAQDIQGKTYFPWLIDESPAFNTNHIFYIKGTSRYLYQNNIVTTHEDIYTDFDKPFEHLVHFRGVDLNYPKLYKIISNVLVYYHRNQYTNIDFNIEVMNEAGHMLLDSANKKPSLQDLRVLKANERLREDEKVRLDSTILDTKVFLPNYQFPCLLADTTIRGTTEKEFSISSITYNYTTIESPESNPYDLYSSILRKTGV